MGWKDAVPPVRSDREASNREGRSESERSSEASKAGPRMEFDLRGIGRCQGPYHCLMASVGVEELRSTHRIPGVEMAAIPESSAVKVRKVRRTDRML